MSRKRLEQNVFKEFEYRQSGVSAVPHHHDDPSGSDSKIDRAHAPHSKRRKCSHDHHVGNDGKSTDNTEELPVLTCSPRVRQSDGRLHFPFCSAFRAPYVTTAADGWFRERYASVSHSFHMHWNSAMKP